MTLIFYALAVLAIVAGLIAVSAVALTRRRLRLEHLRAQWVSGRALEVLARRIDLEERFGIEDVFEIVDRIAQQSGAALVDPLLADLEPGVGRRANQSYLWRQFLYHEHVVPVEPSLGQMLNASSRFKWGLDDRRRGVGRMSVAAIPLAVYARDDRVRANVFGGLYLLTGGSSSSTPAP